MNAQTNLRLNVSGKCLYITEEYHLNLQINKRRKKNLRDDFK